MFVLICFRFGCVVAWVVVSDVVFDRILGLRCGNSSRGADASARFLGCDEIIPVYRCHHALYRFVETA